MLHIYIDADACPVKQEVYRPDWRTSERLEYTKLLARILGRLLKRVTGKIDAEQLKVPTISPTATNDKVTQNSRYVFRACFNDSFQGRVVADYAYKTQGIRMAAARCSSKRSTGGWLPRPKWERRSSASRVATLVFSDAAPKKWKP